ncbi:MAG: DNA-binding response regulator [Verrucomicrobiaceae bacterium]|nr:MAG: DNA-binding response regulator [Verrucomicrobiaceae bacterium]
MSREPQRPPADESPAVHLVDDDEALRTALSRLLQATGHEVRVYASAAELLMARSGRMRGCLLLDVRMPGGPTGLELHQALVRQGETLPVVFLTGHGDIPMSVQAVKNGAFDFLTKPVRREDLLKAVAAALEAEQNAWQAGERRRELACREASLTPTEREVFRRVVAGQPNKRIAAELGCAERTVKAHRSQVMHKMAAASLPELVSMAAEIV